MKDSNGRSRLRDVDGKVSKGEEWMKILEA